MYNSIPEFNMELDIPFRESECIFFILGAGASVDSGLSTYRGPKGMYVETNVDPMKILDIKSPLEDIWEFLTPLYEQISQNSNRLVGPTYEKIGAFFRTHDRSFILTQNIDGYASKTGLPVVEMHGTWETMTCVATSENSTLKVCGIKKPTEINNDKRCSCGGYFRPDILLYEEPLSQTNMTKISLLIKRRPTHVIVIGTSMQFPYLRILINKAKQRGAKVIHINPDENYGENIGHNEIWIKKSSADGLTDLMKDLQ